ncbi:MAG: hypothetical protein GWN99_04320 [Gemmatimonadetes bacterium]|uniref:Calcineurin-like phosphoesterase domain-containing protein n=1 Tax=Candidatus Kutchimonas denitrificans TaxID=3056748 RepID=A0AAE5CCB9_9BACT|nr:hypothetical protein [Gemmatimonadota bacterium]NIR75678.1 hypothetical protein [Candidatus Kutchimonas denitrificans]NIS00290.1 hypothetical protein [Gemmatimonadota bacterium]NIT65949.1 hypothetical protein [Gemmatimonadota bacterium]NIU53646.1 hypothetical protein [Gemmatimonadota bacterium]
MVYLVGDAGDAVRDTPVIAHLKAEVQRRHRSSPVVVAFLGDNIYEHGLHPPSHEGHATEVKRLEAQIDVVRGTTARGVFVPGNHDWGYSGERGLAQVERQGAYLEAVAAAGVDVTLLPRAGCPGPELLEIGTSLLLMMIETDLWLRGDGRAEGEGCRHGSTDEALQAMRAALYENERTDGREVVVLAHHPLLSGGPHAGYFDWKDQLFPGTVLWKPLYIPVPFLYPIVRNLGVSSQDLKHGANRRMREELGAVFREFPDQPLIFAGGHEHTLEIYDADLFGVGRALVSGAGSRLSEVTYHYGARFAAGKALRELGYMRLEFFEDGRVLLSVITDGTGGCDRPGGSSACPGQPTVRYWLWLRG